MLSKIAPTWDFNNVRETLVNLQLSVFMKDWKFDLITLGLSLIEIVITIVVVELIYMLN